MKKLNEESNRFQNDQQDQTIGHRTPANTATTANSSSSPAPSPTLTAGTAPTSSASASSSTTSGAALYNDDLSVAEADSVFLRGHSGSVYKCEPLVDGHHLLTASHDKTGG